MTIQSKDFKKLLIASERNIRTRNWKISADQLTPECRFPWRIKKTVLRGGKQEDVDLISVHNGNLGFSIVPTRGMGLLKAEMDGIRIGWDSPVKEIVHPRQMNLESRGGLGWLEGFNEWVVRCGLESAGAPGRDSFVTNTGSLAEMDLTLHGKIANIPASRLEVAVGRNFPNRIRVIGQVEETMLFGPNFLLNTEISTLPGSNSVRIEDVITNRSGLNREFQLIYHCNFGPPILEKGSRIEAPFRKIFPINHHSASDIHEFDRLGGPTGNFIEQVYCTELNCDRDGKSSVLLRNQAGDRAVKMEILVNQLPYLTIWKNTASLEDGYVVGIEPGTGFPFNRKIERDFGRVPWIGPGESRRFQIIFTVLNSKDSVEMEANNIRKIQAGRECRIDPLPPNLE